MASLITVADLQCPVCMLTVTDHRECQKCEQLFCNLCITKWLAKPNATCPNCRNPGAVTTYSHSKKIERLAALSRASSCPGCNKQFSPPDMEMHIKICEELTKCFSCDGKKCHCCDHKGYLTGKNWVRCRRCSGTGGEFDKFSPTVAEAEVVATAFNGLGEGGGGGGGGAGS